MCVTTPEQFEQSLAAIDGARLVNDGVALAARRRGKMIWGVTDQRPAEVLGGRASPELSDQPRPAMISAVGSHITVELVDSVRFKSHFILTHLTI